jgi:hypothetical protein
MLPDARALPPHPLVQEYADVLDRVRRVADDGRAAV